MKETPSVTPERFEPIAIVGVGCVFAGANHPDELWEMIKSGRDACGEALAGRWVLPPGVARGTVQAQPDRVHTTRGFFANIPKADPDKYPLSMDVLSKLDPGCLMALEAARQAVTPHLEKLGRNRVGVILGHIVLPTAGSCKLALQTLGRTLAENAGIPIPPECEGVEPSWLARPAALPALMISRAYDFGGPSFTLDAACASSFYALKLAADALHSRRVDAMLAGGVSSPDSLYTSMGFSQLRALSPSGMSRPFDHRGDGLMVGEGAGIFLLKRLDDAIRQGDQILGVIRGIGLSNDIGGGLLAPNSEGQLRAMRSAYSQAGWNPAQVDLVECHATGTPLGDGVEFSSLMELWRDQKCPPGKCVIGSVKSNVGHVLTGAGGAGLTKVLWSIRHQTLPPTANYENPSKGVQLEGSPFVVLKDSKPWNQEKSKPRRAALSGFGFGGINAHVLVEEWIGQDLVMKPVEEDSCSLAVVGIAARVGDDTDTGQFWKRASGLSQRNSSTVSAWDDIWKTNWYRSHGFEPPKAYCQNEMRLGADVFRIPPRELAQMLPQQALALDVSREALEGLPLEGDVNVRTGVFLGVGLDLNTTNFHVRWWWQNLRGEKDAQGAGPDLNADKTMGALASVAASRIAREFRLGGSSFTISAEENSGLWALDAAWNALQQRSIDQALVGAVDLCSDPRLIVPLMQEGKLGEPDGSLTHCIADGSAMLIVKRHEDAIRDGNTIYSVICGLGHSRKNPARSGDSRACTDAMMDAFAASTLMPAELGFLVCAEADVEGHQNANWQAIEELIDPRHEPSQVIYQHDGKTVGWAGAASGLLSLATASLALATRRLAGTGNGCSLVNAPPCLLSLASPAPWIRNGISEELSAGVCSPSTMDSWFQVLLRGHGCIEKVPSGQCIPQQLPGVALTECMLVLEGESVKALEEKLERLKGFLEKARGMPFCDLATDWQDQCPRSPESALGMVLILGENEEFGPLCIAARDSLRSMNVEKPWREKIFLTTDPLARLGKTAFVYPGSGADFPSMGREFGLAWPGIFENETGDSETLKNQWLPGYYWQSIPGLSPAPHEKIMAQVSYGCLTTDLLKLFEITPDVSLGYSLGESSALVANHAWFDRDGLWRMLETSSLFRLDLVGPRRAIAKSWDLPDGARPDWVVGLVERSEEKIRGVLGDFDKAYLLIINSARECVIGGDASQVRAVAQKLGCRLFPLPGDTAAVHCEAAKSIADSYRKFHTLPTQAPENLLVYSAAFGSAYEVTKAAAAEAITGLAVDTMDFKSLVETAYQDGARIFIEVGPGASCTRIIGNILEGKTHLARSISSSRGGEMGALLRTLASLISHRVRVNLNPLLKQKSEKRSAARVTMERATPDFKVSRASSILDVQPNQVPATNHSFMPEAEMAFSQLQSNALFLAHATAIQQEGLKAHAEFLNLARQTMEQMTSLVDFQTQLIAANSSMAEWDSQWEPQAPSTNAEPGAQWYPVEAPRFLNREQCLEYARGKIEKVLGDKFAGIDAFPTRVRLPDEPLMLVDRIMDIQGEPCSMGSGRVVTEHDVLPGAWYLDQGRIPTCIAVESGQADLFLSGFLGIDHKTRGKAVYRLLDAQVTFFRSLPKEGDIISYDIRIDRFFRHNETYLFRFWYDATVNGEPLMAMREGCAGFFSDEELARGKGVVVTDPGRLQGVTTPDWRSLVPMQVESYNDAQLDRLRAGDLPGCFGRLFAGLAIKNPAGLPGGRMRLVHRIPKLEPDGGPWGLGRILGEADIHPDDWFLTCHFIDDQVMPGTLMYECCLHTLRILLYRSGWVGEASGVAFEPVPGVAGQLRCRGQVTAKTKKVTYEVMIKERGYRPEPYVIVDAYMHADGRNVVEINSMSLRMTGWSRESVEAIWNQGAVRGTKPVFDNDRILAFAMGKPSEAFGEPYKIFDEERRIARLPGPPYKFLDRITQIRCEPWKMVAGGEIVAQYDIPAQEWYFQSERQNSMPFAVLLEVALQPCGWLAAYIGSALTSPVDLSFRNLGGKAVLKRQVTPSDRLLEVHVRIPKVSSSAGMVVQEYQFEVFCDGESIYKGDTTFGFFTKDALNNQIGVRGAKLFDASGYKQRNEAISAEPPFPDDFLRMLDRLEYLEEKGGSKGLGYARGRKRVDPGEWFFKAHFYQDPVTPGSLGLEAMLQLMKVFASEIWPGVTEFSPMVAREPHIWLYRGQVIPHNRDVVVEVDITRRDDDLGMIIANGKLAVDGLIIYEMRDFRLKAARRGMK